MEKIFTKKIYDNELKKIKKEIFKKNITFIEQEIKRREYLLFLQVLLEKILINKNKIEKQIMSESFYKLKRIYKNLSI